MLFSKRMVERLYSQGWEYSHMGRCGYGHDEPIYSHRDFPGVFLRENRDGGYSLYSDKVYVSEYGRGFDAGFTAAQKLR